MLIFSHPDGIYNQPSIDSNTDDKTQPYTKPCWLLLKKEGSPATTLTRKKVISVRNVRGLKRQWQVSSDQEKLDQLLVKVEEINQKLNRLSDELHTVSASVKSLAVGQITQSNPKPASPTPAPAAPRPATPPAETNRTRSLDDIRMSFPEELEARLDFTEKGDYIIIKPKQFLGSDNFAKIASAIRGMGGEYISQGKDSHFRVPKKKT